MNDEVGAGASPVEPPVETGEPETAPEFEAPAEFDMLPEPGAAIDSGVGAEAGVTAEEAPAALEVSAEFAVPPGSGAQGESEPEADVEGEAGPASTQAAPPAVETAAASEAPAASEPTLLDPVTERLDRITDRLDELARLERTNASHIDSLVEENRRLRTGEIAQAIAPLVRGVIRVHDDILKLEAAPSGDGAATADLALVRRSLVEVLSRAGVEPFEADPGDPFDPARHNGVRGVESDDPAQAGTVAGMMRCGFAYTSDGGRVLRPADVVVFRPTRPRAVPTPGGSGAP